MILRISNHECKLHVSSLVICGVYQNVLFGWEIFAWGYLHFIGENIHEITCEMSWMCEVVVEL